MSTTDTQTEDRIVAALVTVANRNTDIIERAAFWISGWGDHGQDVDEAARIAREHGFDECRLTAMKSLARSRDIELADVLRAALRGDLRDIVRKPPAPGYPGQG